MMSSHTEPVLWRKRDYMKKTPNCRMPTNLVKGAWTSLTTVSHAGTKSALRANNGRFSWWTQRQVLSALHTIPNINVNRVFGLHTKQYFWKCWGLEICPAYFQKQLVYILFDRINKSVLEVNSLWSQSQRKVHVERFQLSSSSSLIRSLFSTHVSRSRRKSSRMASSSVSSRRTLSRW